MPEKVRDKVPVNWRIYAGHINNCKNEAKRLGLGSVPAVVNFIIAQYFNKKGE